MKIKLKKEFEIKSSDDTSDGFAYFSGYVAAYGNKDYQDDIIVKGAFSDAVAEKKQYPLLWNHKTDMPIGSITEVKEDDYGLLVTGRINLSVEKGKEIYQLLKAGDIKKMSVGFITLEREWREENGDRTRIIKKAKLLEGSVVVLPANDNAEIFDVKSIEQLSTLSEVEDVLTSKDFSRNEAKALISVIKKFAKQRDVEQQQDQREVDSEVEKELKDMLSGLLLKMQLEKLSENITQNR